MEIAWFIVIGLQVYIIFYVWLINSNLKRITDNQKEIYKKLEK